jgi:RNA polymerase sigma-54 factor
MAIGPRLEFRQSQTLVMTPQLRQAIKLLQFSNLEVAAFVEEELERNPLLEREETPDFPGEAPAPEPPEIPPSDQTDTADLVGAGTLPEEGAGSAPPTAWRRARASAPAVLRPTTAIWKTCSPIAPA